MTPPTGRLVQARELMQEAATLAMLNGVHEVSIEMRTRSIAFSTRQCCYAAQRSWIRQIERSAIREGKDPNAILRDQLLIGPEGGKYPTPAVWPSASILYRYVMGKHYLVFEFRRIGSDPLWSEILKDKLIVGPPPGSPEVDKIEILDMMEDGNE